MWPVSYRTHTLFSLSQKFRIIRLTVDNAIDKYRFLYHFVAALNVDGGASANNLLMQMQSDISGAPVQRPTCVETTAMGAAYLAGLAVGYWASKEDVVRNRAIDRVFHPEITAEERAAKVKGWSKAVKCSYGWAKDE